MIRQLTVGSVAMMAVAGLVVTPEANASSITAGPCSSQARVDTSTIEDQTYVLCSTDPGRGEMSKQLWMTVDGAQVYKDLSTAPRKGITAGLATPSTGSVAIAASAADQCVVFLTVDAGATWEETLTVDDAAPASDLVFTDAQHGSVRCGWDTTAVTYRTSNGGHTWAVGIG